MKKRVKKEEAREERRKCPQQKSHNTGSQIPPALHPNFAPLPLRKTLAVPGNIVVNLAPVSVD